MSLSYYDTQVRASFKDDEGNNERSLAAVQMIFQTQRTRRFQITASFVEEFIDDYGVESLGAGKIAADLIKLKFREWEVGARILTRILDSSWIWTLEEAELDCDSQLRAVNCVCREFCEVYEDVMKSEVRDVVTAIAAVLQTEGEMELTEWIKYCNRLKTDEEGRAMCHRLSTIRKRYAELFGIPYFETECAFDGPCTGTCIVSKADTNLLISGVCHADEVERRPKISWHDCQM